MATDAAHCAEPPEGIAMANKGWAAFPHPNKAFDYAGDKLAKAWKQLPLMERRSTIKFI